MKVSPPPRWRSTTTEPSRGDRAKHGERNHLLHWAKKAGSEPVEMIYSPVVNNRIEGRESWNDLRGTCGVLMDMRKGGADFRSALQNKYSQYPAAETDGYNRWYHLSLLNISCYSPLDYEQKKLEILLQIWSKQLCMFVPARVNSQRCVNSIPSGILGRQEEVSRATTPLLEGGSSESFFLAATQIEQQEANNLDSSRW